MITAQMSARAWIENYSYNGELGMCRQCGRRTQLQGGLCLACRQAEQRRNPRPAARQGRTCADCGAPVEGPRRRYCDACAETREKANVKAVKARQYRRRKVAL